VQLVKPRTNRRRTALVLIDFVNLFDFEGAQKLAPRAIRAARKTALLIKKLRADRVPVIYANDNFGQWRSDFRGLVNKCVRQGGASADIVAALQPTGEDFAILKPRHSAFYGTPLDFILEELKVERLVLTGIAVDMCVFATAQDSHVRKFSLWIPADCVAGFTASQERSALSLMTRTLAADIRAAVRSPSTHRARAR